MKIVHINHSDNIGGAAIAAYRLSKAMCQAGIESKMLVYRKLRKNDPMVESLIHNRMNLFFHQLRVRLIKNLFKTIFKPLGVFSFPYTGLSFHNNKLVQEADVIILHWIASNMATIGELNRLLSLGKPVFWFMHDEYPFTGGCHLSKDCLKYKSGCIDCPFISRFRNIELPHKQLLKKQNLIKHENLKFIGPSQWIVDLAKGSLLLKNKSIRVCRNVIDTDIFKPENANSIKEKIGLNPQKKTILFCAASIQDEIKGWNYLAKALSLLPKESYQCLVLGADIKPTNVDMEMYYLGYVKDEKEIASIYNMADVFVTPSLVESFSLVVAEAMSCGIPCVGFDTAAIPGLINHKITGYIAKYKSPEDLAAGIRWICEESDYDSLSNTGRQYVENNCSFHKVLGIYSVLFDN